MQTQGDLTATYQTEVTEAANRASLMLAGVETQKGDLMRAMCAAIVARVLGDDGETPKAASSWARAGIDKNAKAWASASAYASAMVWRLDSATVAHLRRMVTPEAKNDRDTFAAIVTAAVVQIGDYWKAYKGRAKAEPKAETPAPAEAPAVDPAMVALTETLGYLDGLAKAGDRETLCLVFDHLRGLFADNGPLLAAEAAQAA